MILRHASAFGVAASQHALSFGEVLFGSLAIPFHRFHSILGYAQITEQKCITKFPLAFGVALVRLRAELANNSRSASLCCAGN